MPSSGGQRFLALGDSYTVGEGVHADDAWPAQLVRALRAEGVDVADPIIVAETGWITADLDRALAARALSGPFALVTVLTGVNNQYRGMILRGYRGQLRRLLRHALALAGDPSRLVVISIPDWGVTPFNTRRVPDRVARQIDAYNRATQDAAVAIGARWIDITDLSRADPTAVVADGLHPDATMYQRWVERMLPTMRAILHRPELTPIP